MSDRVDPHYLWYNGAIVPWETATLHVTSTIWTGISTVFEGIRAYWNADTEEMHIFRLHEHVQRLRQSVRLIRMSLLYDPRGLVESLPALLMANEIREDTYIRVVAFPSERRMASRADEEMINLVADTAPLASRLDDDRVLHLMVSSFTRISDAVMSPQIKSIANYRNSEIAVQEAKLAGYDSTILLNRAGEVSEGAWSNLFLIRGGMLVTPHLGSDILGGITRDTFIRLAREFAGLDVAESGVTRTELYLADEAFLCGTALEIQGIGSIDRFTIGNGEIGPITRRLRSAYAAAVRGDGGAYPEWRTTIRQAHSVG